MTSAVTDFSQYSRMRLGADANDPAVLREVAGQFEALFIEILLKDMRNSRLGEPIFGQSQQHDMYLEMLDKQFAIEMSKGSGNGGGIGIADLLTMQLGGSAGVDSSTPKLDGVSVPPSSLAVSAAKSGTPISGGPTAYWSDPKDFARDVWPHAQRAGNRLGIAPESLLAQAALETGWGSQVLRRSSGDSSLNLFGIKAGRSWDGESVAQPTLEYRDGVARREVARFRAYADVGASFDDYVALIYGRPRYSEVIGSGRDISRFGVALQDAGYATDPDYAQKIERIAAGETMREVLASLKNRRNPPTNYLSQGVLTQQAVGL